MSDEKAREWVAFLEPAEIGGMARVILLFENTGVLPPDEAWEWRRAMLDRWGVPVAEGSA